MQKVYLLLRDNRQTGPHSLEELVHMGLKPFDLIWVEGKSFGWSYPSEVATLKPYAPPLPEPTSHTTKADDVQTPLINESKFSAVSDAAVPKKIFVSLPGNARKQVVAGGNNPSETLERKAEDLRSRVQAYAEGNRQRPSELETKYARTLTDVEEDFTSWMYQQKTAKKNHLKKYSKPIAASILIITAIFLAIQQIGREGVPRPAQEVQVNMAQKESTTHEAIPEKEIMQAASPAKAEGPAHNDVAKTIPSLPEGKVGGTIYKPPANRKTSHPVSTTFKNEESLEKPVESEEMLLGSATTGQGVEVTVQKKKTLGQKIDGFFEKIKNRSEEAKASEATEGERKAFRREATTEIVDLKEFANVTANERSNDWMMGIQGLKLSLVNKGNLTIDKAGVEVRYYNEQNDLLEKKVLYFNNVLPKKSVTISAPDHRLADHVDYRVISASGMDERYARQ